jgi:uncharacterized membrane protein
MPQEEHLITANKEVAIFDKITQIEQHKSNNEKEIRLAEIAMSEKTAKIEIESKSRHLQEEKDFRLTNTKRLYIVLVIFFIILITFITYLINSDNKDLVIPILSFLAGALGGFGYGKSRK